MGLIGQQQFTGGNGRATMMGRGPQGPAMQGRGPAQRKFPANEEDVYKFIVDIRRALYSEQQQAQIVQILQGSNRIGQAIGQLAGQVVMTAIKRRMQEQGVKPHINLAIMGIKMAVESLLEMASLIIMQEAAVVASVIVENASGIQIPRGQMQGQMRGQMQGPQQTQGQMQQPMMRPQGQPMMRPQGAMQ